MYKVIPEYPNYSCSENGVIINNKTNKVLTQSIDRKGYIRHCVSHNGIRHIVFPHRIVAKLYVENPDNKPYVNHIDGNKQNNYYKNLEWCTNRENVLHAIYVLNKQVGGINKKRVICIETGEVFNSTLEAEQKTGIKNSWISSICRNKKHSARGYHFKYCDE